MHAATAATAAAPAPRPTPTPTELVVTSVMRRGNHEVHDLEAALASPLGRRVARQVARGDRLTFLLPAFPAKSSNRDKTDGPLPDLGELLALRNLEEMCREIEEVHPAGARVVICSDGRVFNDLVMVTDADLEAYSREMDRLLREEGLTHLRTYCLDDCGDVLGEGDLRAELVRRFGPAVDEIREGVRSCPDRRSMFNGIHRFMKDDLSFHHPELSKNQLMKRSKALAYQVIQRSQSWDNLLETCFPEALRLSIHPYPVTHRKFGVKLVPGSDRWATPWHNVTVRVGGDFVLMKRRQALALGATRTLFEGRYAGYVL